MFDGKMRKEINYKKILLVLSLSLIIIFFLRFGIRTYLYWFKRNDIPLANVHPYFISKEGLKKIIPEDCHSNRFKDSIFFYDYEQNKELVILKVEQYNSIPLSEIKMDNAGKKISSSEISDVFNVVQHKFPFLAFTFIPEIKKTSNLKLYFENAKEDSTIITKNFIYSAINFTDILFYSNYQFNLMISKHPESPSANILFFNSRKAFYFVIMYSLNKSKIANNELLNILNLDSLTSN